MIDNSKLKYTIVLIIIKTLYVYLNILMLPQYWVGEFGFDREINIDNIIFEIVSFILGLAIYIKYLKPGHPISFAITVFFCLYVIPSNSCMVLSNYSALYYICINTFNLLLLWFLGKHVSGNNYGVQSYTHGDSSLDSNKKLQGIFRFLTIFTCLGIIVYVYFMRGSLSIDGIFTEDIYETRAKVAEMYLENTGGAIAYLMTFWKAFYSTMLIFGLYNSLKNRRYFDILLCLYAFLLLFSFEMQKSIIFRPFIALFVFYLYKTRRVTKADLVFMYIYCGIYLVSFAEYLIAKDSFIYTLVIRRMAYMPQFLSHAYYDFFSTHDKIWLTRDFFQLEKIVRLFYPGSYAHGAVVVISENCFPGIPSPNTGLFAEAFAQMGYLGIIVFPLLLSYLINIYYKYSLVFGKDASTVLLSAFVLSMINIQVLAPRGILMVLIFILIAYWAKTVSHVKNI